MSRRREHSYESESDESSSSSDGRRYSRLKSTVSKPPVDQKGKHSDSEEEGLYTGSDSDNDDNTNKGNKESPTNHSSKEKSSESGDGTSADARRPKPAGERKQPEDSDEPRDEFKEQLEDYKERRDRVRRGERSRRGEGSRRGERSSKGRRDERWSDDRDRRQNRMEGNEERDRWDRYRDVRRPRYDRDRDSNRGRTDRSGEGDRSRITENGEEKHDKEESEKSLKRRRDDDDSNNVGATDGANGSAESKKAKKNDLLTTRTGGAYIPPAKLKMMQQNITDKSSEAYQRISWEALKKSINGLVNKVNVSNIGNIIRELFAENLVRGRGLLSRSIIQAQAASPTFTHVYAALVAIVNTKFPQNGELVLKRLILQFKRGYRRNDKAICLTATKFLGHLVNQQVAHEVIALEILTLLLENPTDDSVEIAVGFLKEVGQKLTDVSPRGIHAIFERLRNILHEATIDLRVQYMIEVMFAVRKDGFKDHISVSQELDLVEEDDQFTHLLTLEDVTDGEDLLNVFRNDPEFLENEEKYKDIKKSILDSDSSDDEGSGSGSGSDSSDSDEEEDEEAKQVIIDNTETNLVALRRTIYLTIQSSLDFEECAHKLMKMELKPGQEHELCNMILDCCAQQRTFEKFYALLGQRFCQIDKKFIGPYEQIFQEQYDTIHRLETAKLRNVAKFFAHLLHTDAISWGVLQCIKLNEDDTTSSSRIFIKILFQELSEFMGLPKLNTRLKDVTLAPFFEGLFPRDNPRNTRFAINFFTSIGLGGLTDELRDHLKNQPKKPAVEQLPEGGSASSDSSSSSEESSSSSSASDSSSDSEPVLKRRSKKGGSSKKTKSESSPKLTKKNTGKQKQRKKRQKVSEDSDSDSEPEMERGKEIREHKHRKGKVERDMVERESRRQKETSRRGKENVLYEDGAGERDRKGGKRVDERSDSGDRYNRRGSRDEGSGMSDRRSKRDRNVEEIRSRKKMADDYGRDEGGDKYEKRRNRSRERDTEDIRRSSTRRR